MRSIRSSSHALAAVAEAMAGPVLCRVGSGLELESGLTGWGYGEGAGSGVRVRVRVRFRVRVGVRVDG